jgi:hypothetical protein
VPRHFVSQFLLPMVKGGALAIGRPLGRRGVESLATRAGAEERAAAEVLARSRRELLATLVRNPPRPALDEATWRLGGAVHNLLALGHPEIALGVGADLRVGRVANAAATLAALGPPTTLAETLARHSILARLPEIIRRDRTVRYWLGRQTFVGRPPPARILALPRVRGVKVETVRRAWLRDVGVPAVARPAFLALTEASPLGEALDPLRLDPPLAWGRILPILRFPAICRLVAGRLVELGVGQAGDALADALYRFVSLEESTGASAVSTSAEAVAFALRFLAHLVWLDLLFGAASPPGRRVARFRPGPALRPASGSLVRAAAGDQERALARGARAGRGRHLTGPVPHECGIRFWRTA